MIDFLFSLLHLAFVLALSLLVTFLIVLSEPVKSGKSTQQISPYPSLIEHISGKLDDEPEPDFAVPEDMKYADADEQQYMTIQPGAADVLK